MVRITFFLNYCVFADPLWQILIGTDKTWSNVYLRNSNWHNSILTHDFIVSFTNFRIIHNRWWEKNDCWRRNFEHPSISRRMLRPKAADRLFIAKNDYDYFWNIWYCSIKCALTRFCRNFNFTWPNLKPILSLVICTFRSWYIWTFMHDLILHFLTEHSRTWGNVFKT